MIINHSELLDKVRKISNQDISLRKICVEGWGMRLQQSFKSVFAQHGEVVFAVVFVDKISGKNKGYGFVTYRHLDGALSALQEPSKEIDGRFVVSNLAAAGQL